MAAHLQVCTHIFQIPIARKPLTAQYACYPHLEPGDGDLVIADGRGDRGPPSGHLLRKLAQSRHRGHSDQRTGRVAPATPLELLTMLDLELTLAARVAGHGPGARVLAPGVAALGAHACLPQEAPALSVAPRDAAHPSHPFHHALSLPDVNDSPLPMAIVIGRRPRGAQSR